MGSEGFFKATEPDGTAPPSGGVRRSRLLGIEQRLLRRLRGREFGPGTILVVGFSGGTDSLALAAALGRVADLGRVEIILAQVDHGLRPESPAEQDRAEEIARLLALRFHRLALDSHPAERHPGVGIEEAARRERFRVLAALCREAGARCLVLAHQRDDQAETVLLHLLRGAGLPGARGMAEWGERSVPWWDASDGVDVLGIWRPLLDEARVDLAAYIAARGLAAIADPSNDDHRFRRNEVRHVLLPQVEAVVPGAAAALARYGRLVAADDDALDGWARRLVRSGTAADGSFTLATLRHEPPAVARRAVRVWLGDQSRGTIEVTAERVEALLERIATEAGGRIELGGGWTAVARSGRLGLNRAGEG